MVAVHRHSVSCVDSLAAFFTECFLDLPVVVWLTPAVAWALRPVARIPVDGVRKVSQHLLELLKSVTGLLRGGPLCGDLLVGAIAWGAEGEAFNFIAERLGVELSLAMAVGA